MGGFEGFWPLGTTKMVDDGLFFMSDWHREGVEMVLHFRKFTWNPKLNLTWRLGRWLYIYISFSIGLYMFRFHVNFSDSQVELCPTKDPIWSQFDSKHSCLTTNLYNLTPATPTTTTVKLGCPTRREKRFLLRGQDTKPVVFANSGNSWRSIYVVVKHPCERMI